MKIEIYETLKIYPEGIKTIHSPFGEIAVKFSD